MRSILPVLSIGCLIVLGSLAPSYAKDKTESPELQKAWGSYHDLDHELTDLYQKILISLPTADEREKFTVGQNAWLKYRGIEGEFESRDAKGDTDEPKLIASFTEMTNARLAQLKAWQAAHPAK